VEKKMRTIEMPEASSALVVNTDFSVRVHLPQDQEEGEVVEQSSMLVAMIGAMISHSDPEFRDLIEQKLSTYFKIEPEKEKP